MFSKIRPRSIFDFGCMISVGVYLNPKLGPLSIKAILKHFKIYFAHLRVRFLSDIRTTDLTDLTDLTLIFS